MTEIQILLIIWLPSFLICRFLLRVIAKSEKNLVKRDDVVCQAVTFTIVPMFNTVAIIIFSAWLLWVKRNDIVTWIISRDLMNK